MHCVQICDSPSGASTTATEEPTIGAVADGRRYLAGWGGACGRVHVLGFLSARDVVDASIRAWKLWPGCGVAPVPAATAAQPRRARPQGRQP